MSGSVLVKSPVISQGWDITVTAPYVWTIPTGFYDGTEVLTANGIPISWWAYFIDANIRSTASTWWVTSTRYNANATVDVWSYIYSFIEFDNWAGTKYIVVARLDKSNNTVLTLTEWSYSSSDILQSVYINSWVVVFNLNSSPAPIIRIEYTISSNIWNWYVWHNTSWLLLTDSIPYLWYNIRWLSLIQPTWWLSNSRYLTWFYLS